MTTTPNTDALLPDELQEWALNEIHMNDLQIESLRAFSSLVKHGAKSIDIRVRKDGKQYRFEADFLKWLLPSYPLGDFPKTDFLRFLNTRTPAPSVTSEVEELRRFKRNTEAMLYLIGEECAFMGANWSDEVETKGYVKECYLGSIGCLLMNDTFYYASADAEGVGFDEWPKLKEIYDEWGQEGLIAWVAIKRGHDPEVRGVANEKFHAAKQAILTQFNVSKKEG